MEVEWNQRRVVAEHQGRDRYLVMFEDGEVREFATAQAVEAHVRRQDKEAAKAGQSTLTELVWQ